MRYVNCARDRQEQNLAAYQQEQEIYYRVLKDISPGRELLVLYDEDYALDLFAGSSSAEFIRMTQKLETVLEDNKVSKIDGDVGGGVVLTDGDVGGGVVLTDDVADEQVVGGTSGDDSSDRDAVINHSGTCPSPEDCLGRLGGDTVAGAAEDMDSESYDSDDLLECSECKEIFCGEDDFLAHGCCKHLSPGGVGNAGNLEQSNDGDADHRNLKPLLEEESGKGSSAALGNANGDSTTVADSGTTGNSHKCPLCWEGFPNLEVVLEHCKSHEGWKSAICQRCRQVFAADADLEAHVCRSFVDEREKTQLESDLSFEKPFRDMSKSLEHAKLFHVFAGNKGRCNYCGKDVSNVKEHVRIHTGAKPYKCSICAKDFRFHSSLSQHLKTHTNEKAYKCEVCGKAFAHSSNLSQHRKTHSTVTDKPHKCDHCSKSFHLKSHLVQHLRMHSDSRPFECEHCHKRFSSKSYLAFHVKSHLGEKAYECAQCSKTFTQKVYLKQHMKTHSDEKAYTCEHCGKKFRHQSNLSQHHRVHSSDKPFRCEICNKSFSRQQNLRQHQVTHVH